jgi:TonB family protein
MARKVAALTLPPEPPKQPPPPPKPPPPPPKPLPPTPKIEPPKIKMPEPNKPPPEIKPVIMPTPKPVVITPPAPKAVVPPPAPKIVNLGQPHAAAIANNDAHPSAVRMGNPEIRALNGPAVATPVNLGGGIHGMNASNTGSGPHAASVNLGNGSPNGTNLNGHDRAVTPVKGFGNGVPGGTGTGRNGPVAVQIAGPSQAPPPQRQEVAHTMASKPTLVFKPTPVYPAEARAAHIEGNVQVRIRVTPAGTTEFISITHGLGHGLDESARQVVQGMRWKPAMDATGHPVDWVGDVIVVFELS